MNAPDPRALALSDAEAYDDLRAHEWETAERDTDFFDAPMLSVAEDWREVARAMKAADPERSNASIARELGRRTSAVWKAVNTERTRELNRISHHRSPSEREWRAAAYATVEHAGDSYIITNAAAQRLWSLIDLQGDGCHCWLWRGSIDHKGYGRFGLRSGLMTRAHRLVYQLLVGPIPEGLTIDHVRARGCRSRACVNPAHLEPVTNRENVLRGTGPTAQKARLTRCQRGHELADENLFIDSNGKRGCRACQRLRKQYGLASNIPNAPSSAAEAMIPTHGAPSQARAVDSLPPAPSSAPADAPAGRTPSSLSAGASAPPCPRCGGEEVVAIGGPDMFGNYETTQCQCAYPKENT